MTNLPPPVPSRAGRPALSGQSTPPPLPSRDGRPNLTGVKPIPPPVPWRGNRPGLSLSPEAAAEVQKFVSAPILYMQTQVVKPEDGSPTGSNIGKGRSVADHLLDQYGDKLGRKDAWIHLQQAADHKRLADTISYMFFEQQPDIMLARAVKQPRGGALPIYFLPWKSQKITQFEIPEIPNNLADWDDSEYPRFFFTAALSGCSVFVKGTPTAATVYHGGISGDVKLTQQSDEFWAETLNFLAAGYSKAALRAQLRKQSYLPTNRPAVQNYIAWLESKKPGATLNLDVTACSACFFGIRFGRSWTFYVQEHITTEKFRIISADQVEAGTEGGTSFTNYKETATNKSAKLLTPAVKRQLGPFRFGEKLKATYRVTDATVSRPIGVREIFPNYSQTSLPVGFSVDVAVS